MKTPRPIAFMVCIAGVLLAAVVSITSAVFADSSGDIAIDPGATVGGLRLEAHAHLIKHEGEKQLIIRAYLINEGSEEATVLTKGLGASMGRDAKGLVVGFDYTGRQKHHGRLIIPSLHPNEPVTLRPGEVAMLSARLSGKSHVATLKDGEKIRVGYFVWDGWGERFDMWHGYVCAVVPVEEMSSD